MWLHQISNKLRNLAYSDRNQLLADFQAIRANCVAYNSPDCGKYGGPSETLSPPPSVSCPSAGRCVILPSSPEQGARFLRER